MRTKASAGLNKNDNDAHGENHALSNETWRPSRVLWCHLKL